MNRLEEVLARIEDLAYKTDISADELKELQELQKERKALETQAEAQAVIEAEREAEAKVELEAKEKELREELKEENEAAIEEAVKEAREKWEEEHGRRKAPVTAEGDVTPLSIKVSSPFDRLDTMDLCIRYELLKSYGKQPSQKFWVALAERAVKMSREEDVAYVENGREVKTSAIDWEGLIPKDLDFAEDAEKDLFGVKAGDLSRYIQDKSALASDVVTPTGVRQLHQIALKGNELIYSTQGSYGDEWVPTLMNAQLWRTIRLNAAVLPLFEQFNMPSQPYEYPVESGDPTFYTVAEATDEAHLILTGGPFADSKVGTGKLTFSAGKLGALSYWTEEMEEDSIIATEPQLRDQYALAFAHNIDYVLINGDETLANTNICTEGSTPTGPERFVMIDGLRHEPMVTTTPDKRDGATLTIDDFGATQALMGTAGKYGVNPSDLVFLSDTAVWHKAKLMGEVLTVDKFGPMATVRTGQLAAVFGSPYIISEDYPLTDATGHIDDTAGDNVKGSFMCINKRGVLIGWRRRPRIRVFGIPGAESRAIIGSARFDMQFRAAGMVALSYNLTV